MDEKNGMKKRCLRCCRTKKRVYFSNCRARADGLQDWCKLCHSKHKKALYRAQPEQYREKGRKYYWADPEKHRKRHREYSRKARRENPAKFRNADLRRHYGMGGDDYKRLLTKQHKRCAICQKPEAQNRFGHLYVDHDHKTNKVRGLLCNNCNRWLSGFGDELKGIMRVVRYLRRPPARGVIQ